jgi:hypothetical protein
MSRSRYDAVENTGKAITDTLGEAVETGVGSVTRSTLHGGVITAATKKILQAINENTQDAHEADVTDMAAAISGGIAGKVPAIGLGGGVRSAMGLDSSISDAFKRKRAGEI